MYTLGYCPCMHLLLYAFTLSHIYVYMHLYSRTFTFICICTIVLYLRCNIQSKVGIHTTQKLAPKEKTRFDVLLCEQAEGWKNKFYSKFKNLFDRQGCSKNHVVSTKFKYPLCPLQEKGRRIPIHIQEKVYEEMKKLLKEGHIERLDKCTSDCFIAPIVITVKKDDSIKLALDAKPTNR